MLGGQRPLIHMGQSPPAQMGHSPPVQMGQSPPMHVLENLLAQGNAAIQQEEVDPRKLCILGLPWDTTEEMLQSYFSQYGPLEEATIIRKAKTGESRGFGFVTYRNAADAQHVRMREHNVGGRHCDAKQALPRGTANPSRTTRLFIGRIPPGVTDIELRDYFEQFGKVQDAYIPKDPATAKQAHRGFGFVTFASADDVDKVMSCAHSINNQELAVQCAIPKDKGTEFGPTKAGRWWQGQPESYPSSAESSISTMLAPGQGYFAFGSPHMPGIPQYPVVNQSLGGHEVSTSSLPGEFGRSAGLYAREDHPQPQQQQPQPHANGVASTSGRLPSGLLNLQAGSSSGSLDPGNMERLGFGAGSTNSNPGSRRSSVDLHSVQRLGSNDSSQMVNDQTVQALQGLTFGGSGDGIGIGLALLQARSQAATQAQAPQGVFSMDLPGGRPGFPPLSHHQPPLMHPSNLSGARQHQQNGTALRHLAPRPAYGSSSSSSHGGNSGPADANAGPRIFLGKLNKDTNEQDVKEYFTKFGYVLDVYMPRDKVKRSEHRGFGFVTFETEAAIQRIAQHGPHQIKGSIIAIDSAVPRRGEPPSSSEDADDRTPTAVSAAAAAAAAHAALLSPAYNTLSVISPTASGAIGFGNGNISGSPSGSNFGMNGMGSPGSASHHGSSPTMPTSGSAASITGSEQQHQRQASFEQDHRPGAEGYGPARNMPLDRVRNGFKQY